MVRHGESVGNRDGYFTGSMDIALSEEGIEQAKQAHKALNMHQHKPDIIVPPLIVQSIRRKLLIKPKN